MRHVNRPALPKLLIPLVGACVGILVGTELNYRGVFITSLLVWGGFAVCLSLCLRHLYTTKRLSLVGLTVLIFLLAFGASNHFYQDLQTSVSSASDLSLEDLSGPQHLIIIEDTRSYPDSQASEALLITPSGEQLRFRVFWSDRSLSLPKGTHIRASYSFKPLNQEQRWLYDKGITGTLSLRSIETQGFSDDAWGALDRFRNENVERILHKDSTGAGLLLGVLLGYRESLQGSATEQDFITCGLTHLIAVSGSHLAVVAALMGWLLRRLPLQRVIEVALLLLVLMLYVMLTGLQASAIRSALMAGVGGCSLFVGRRAHAPSGLVCAACAMLLLYPPTLYSIGFWLSVCAVSGITIFTGLITQWLDTAILHPLKYQTGGISSALALTLTASCATLPLAAPAFAVLSLVGPLANLLVAPLISLVLILGILALMSPSFCTPLTNVLLDSALMISEGIVWIAEQLARIPYASVPFELDASLGLIAGVGLASLLYRMWPRPSKLVARIAGVILSALVALALFVVPASSSAKLVVMDIGQGDALLVQEEGRTVLIDTGASERALTHALARNRITQIDAVVITHLDDDHAGALSRLRGLVGVETVYFAEGLLQNQAHDTFIAAAAELVGPKQVRTLAYRDRITLGSTLSMEVLWPEEPANEGSNEESLCLLLCYDHNEDGVPEQQALLAGDAESEELTQILESTPALKAQIIKLGHHGSRGAISSQQLQALQSELVLISVGANNRYGHPSQEIVELVREQGCTLLRTDENGDITCLFRDGIVALSYATMNDALY